MPKTKKQLAARKERRETRKVLKRSLNPALPLGPSPPNDFKYYRKQAKRWIKDNVKSTGISHVERNILRQWLELTQEEVARGPGAKAGVRLTADGQAVMERIEEERNDARRKEGVTGRIKDWWPKPVKKGKEVEKPEEGMEIEGEKAEDHGGMTLGEDFVVTLRPKNGSTIEGAASELERLEI